MVPKIPPTMEPALTPLEVVVVELEATAAVPVPDEEGVYVIYVATVLLATTTVSAEVATAGVDAAEVEEPVEVALLVLLVEEVVFEVGELVALVLELLLEEVVAEVVADVVFAAEVTA